MVNSPEEAVLEGAFSTSSLGAMAAWLALAAAGVLGPGVWRNRLLVAGGRAAPIALCVAYAITLWRYWGSAPGGGFSSLSSVALLFSVPGKALGAWLHFLAFDLLVGRWLVDHALSDGRSRFPLVLALPATFLYGPIGVLLYAGVQGATSHALAARMRQQSRNSNV